MIFKPPNESERLQAIGPTDGLPEILQRAFSPGPHFQPIPAPGPSDWLAVFPEKGQTFPQLARARRRTPTPARSTIYLQPIGSFSDEQAAMLKTLADYESAYFGLKVELLSPSEIAGVTTRTNPSTGKRQLLTTDVLASARQRLPQDAFCLLTITMEDLYPDPSGNFVFGQASLQDGVGVFSFARYAPLFYGGKRPEDYSLLLLRRSCRVMAHETGHMFGLEHCIFFKCVLNGSNHLLESDSRPLHLCPVCLRKFQSAVGFDVVQRYQALHAFYQKAGLADEAAWVKSRLEWILRGTSTE